MAVIGVVIVISEVCKKKRKKNSSLRTRMQVWIITNTEILEMLSVPLAVGKSMLAAIEKASRPASVITVVNV